MVDYSQPIPSSVPISPVNYNNNNNNNNNNKDDIYNENDDLVIDKKVFNS